MNSIKIMFNFNFNVLKCLNEMAYSREEFRKSLDNWTYQISVNWIFIRYCTISKRFQNDLQLHWASELANKFLIPLRNKKLKKESLVARKSVVNYQWFDLDEIQSKNLMISSWIRTKIEEENRNDKFYKLNLKFDDNFRKAIKDICEYGFLELAELIAKGTEDEIKNYCYNEI